MPTWTTDDTIATIRVRCRIPDGSTAFSNAEILEIMTEELFATVVPVVRKANAEFYVRSYDHTIVAGTDSYRIPTRAQHTKLRDVTLLDDNGNNEASLGEISLEDRGRYKASGGRWWAVGTAFCVQGNHVVLVPTPTNVAGATLRLRYYCRPGKLVLTSVCDRVDGISAAPVYEVENAAALFDVGDVVDFIEDVPGFDWLAQDAVVTASLEDDLTFATVPSTEIAVGTYICPAGSSCMVQIPPEVFPFLVALVSARVQESLGYTEQAQLAMAFADRYQRNVQSMVEPRSDGGSRPLINRSSALRGGRR